MPGKSAILAGAQIGMSAIGMFSAYNNQKQQMANLRNERAWNFHYAEVDKQQKMMLSRKRDRKALSEKRAMMGIRNVEMATGSTLLELNSTVDELQEELYWIGRGSERDFNLIRMRSASQAKAIQDKYGASLMTSAGHAFTAYGLYQHGLKLTELNKNLSKYNPSGYKKTSWHFGSQLGNYKAYQS